MRIVIAGGPNAGKTTLAGSLGHDGRLVRSTDELREMGWSEASQAASEWFDEPGPWVIEGVAAPRALRKWLARNPEGVPCDRLVWLDGARGELLKGQDAMRKGCETVLAGILPDLVARGVSVVAVRVSDDDSLKSLTELAEA